MTKTRMANPANVDQRMETVPIFVILEPMAFYAALDVVAIVWMENVITEMALVYKDVLPVGRETSAPNQTVHLTSTA